MLARSCSALETKKQVTLAMNDGATVELGEIGAGMEMGETWRIEGVVMPAGGPSYDDLVPTLSTSSSTANRSWRSS